MFSICVKGAQRRIDADDRQMDPIYCAVKVCEVDGGIINVLQTSRASSNWAGNLQIDPEESWRELTRNTSPGRRKCTE